MHCMHHYTETLLNLRIAPYFTPYTQLKVYEVVLLFDAGGALLQIWVNFIPSMDKLSHAQ